MYGFYRTGFQVVNLMQILIFGLIFVFVIVSLVRSIRRWGKDEKSPRLTVDAKVAAKRTARQRRMSNKRCSGRDYTNYYATFQFESGDRLELELKSYEFGLLVEGDKGKLTFQGSRYLGFERT